MSHETSTDATRNEPLAVRAQKRRAELATSLEELPADAQRERGDIELALSTLDSLLTGDVEHLSAATAADINRWLEHNKHLAARTPMASPVETQSDEAQVESPADDSATAPVDARRMPPTAT